MSLLTRLGFIPSVMPFARATSLIQPPVMQVFIGEEKGARKRSELEVCFKLMRGEYSGIQQNNATYKYSDYESVGEGV